MSGWVLVGIVLGVLAALILLFVLGRLFVRRRRRASETGELKRDLMAWRNLRALAQGGEEARQAKADLASRIGQIRALFQVGLRLQREQASTVRTPWFLLLGEPESGKSSLLSAADLALHAGLRLDGVEKHPLVPWAGGSAYVLEVGGRVFFDRWLEGSGAEWDETISLLRNQRARAPLDGVILCVPADALLADSDTLTREKISLIGVELRRLRHRLGINLPCHVIVTKCDMLCGWREAFAGLDEATRRSAFGWRNADPMHPFSAAAFADWWTDAVGGLKDALVPRLQEEAEPCGGVRMAQAGRAYLLPQSFQAMRANLQSYLAYLFGPEAWHGCDQLLLGGVFFTSALDTGTVLSSAFAAQAGGKIDEKPLVGTAHPLPGGLFLHDVLTTFIFGRRLAASFTPGVIFRRQLPGYCAAAALVALGVFWLSTAFRGSTRLTQQFVRPTAFYREVTRAFQTDAFRDSPLFACDASGRVHLLEEEAMSHDANVSRIRYLHRLRAGADEPTDTPFGWWLSSLCRFGSLSSAERHARRTVFNRAQSDMVFVPLVRSFIEHEKHALNAPFTQLRRQAFDEYNNLLLQAHGENKTHVQAAPLIQYLVKDCSNELLQLLGQYYDDADGCRNETDAEIILDIESAKAQRKLFGAFFQAWSTLSIYPESDYAAVRTTVTNGLNFVEGNRALMALTPRLQSESQSARRTALAEARTLLAQQARYREAMDGHFSALAQTDAPAAGTNAVAARKAMPVRDAVEDAIGDYGRRMEDDRQSVHENVLDAHKLRNERMVRAYFDTLGGTVLDRRFEQIADRFRTESETLRAGVSTLRRSGLTSPLKTANKDKEVQEAVPPPFAFTVQGALCQAAAQAAERQPLTDPLRLAEALDRNRAQAAAAESALAAAAGAWAADPTLAPLVAALRAYQTAQSDENNELTLAEYVQLHPHTTMEITALAQQLSVDQMQDSVDFFKKILGLRTFSKMRNLSGTQRIMEAYAAIRPVMHPKPDDKGATPAVPAVPDYEDLEKALDAYIGEYIAALETALGSLQPDSLQTWAAFRDYCTQLRPYVVNGMLQAASVKVGDFLRQLPAASLSKDVLEQRSKILKRQEQRLQLLTPHFTETCIRQAAAWSLLPADATQAAKRLREAPAQTLMNDYFAACGETPETQIPWWRALFLRGLALVQREALSAGGASLRREGCQYLRFPLCRDAVVTDEVLTDEGLTHVYDALVSCGATPPAPAAEGEKSEKTDPKASKADESGHALLALVRGASAVTADGEPARTPPIDLARGTQMLALVDRLLLHRYETVWTLILPPLEKVLELQAQCYPTLPLASFRFRYGEVFVAGRPRGEPAALDPSAETVFARGDLGDANLSLRFREFSDSPGYAASVSFNGPWSVLRLYFTPGAVVDPLAKTVYLPVTVRDRYDQASVFWIGLRFNCPLPLPAEWPSTENWLDSRPSAR